MRHPLPSVFENIHYVLVNKPPGLKCDYSQKTIAKGLINNELVPILIKSYPNLKPIHRLDSRVTGGIIYALNKYSSQMFSRNLQKGGSSGFIFKRRYIGIIPKITNLPNNDSIIYSNETKTKGYIKTQDPNNSFSTTKFIIPDTTINQDLQLIILQLETGKKHQIRKHLSQCLGLPLVNDIIYGSDITKADYRNQIALHSSFVMTKIGKEINNHYIPVLDGVDIWKGFINDQGRFNKEVEDILINFDERLVE
ncbi:Ribosomal large subunit pseudouridine synthase D [Wickerhamomyces ciferrii]|uniref:21S rRNA pseudouridine(2819) synthase n=1 Tax=Wickerhamomyces ciferrii (strain ATCC 14091 / BCRC 22168 / CBS 111 / JCM 3599 / NBRC 0793 / NRRL Y-1031 F-60-10) TaxID=1206466 RepID=K0KWY6_WICCF|nr:Ribosomal large subunit pseudouridine synthase D [Wickerhamomyces ciferrii]CCH45613.1 Ribosomal large subunit pseudouridine synthase D [Wickerhamomyces ciferrii]